MSGRMRAPTVFLENPVIAQRHFNAVAFAAFLRERKIVRGCYPSASSVFALKDLCLPKSGLRCLQPGGSSAHLKHISIFRPGLQRVLRQIYFIRRKIMSWSICSVESLRRKAAALDGDKGYRALINSLGAELIDLIAERRQRVEAGAPD